MRVGFTGTRHGMTDAKKATLWNILSGLQVDEFHHGDCVGADDEAAKITSVCQGDCVIVCHPPLVESLRAFNKQHHQIRQSKTYLLRNCDIVNETDVLIAAPCDAKKKQTGGTWATIRYARTQGKRVIILWPDGTQSEENAS